MKTFAKVNSHFIYYIVGEDVTSMEQWFLKKIKHTTPKRKVHNA